MTWKRYLPAFLAICFFLPVAAAAQNGNCAGAMLTVNRSADVYAAPDLGILNLSIRSSAPEAAVALAENERKAGQVRSTLAALGFAPGRLQITPVAFSRLGGPYYGPNQPEITGIEAIQFVHVFFSGAALEESQLNAKVAAVIDALAKVGIAPAFVPGQPYRQQNGMLVFTVKTPQAFERQAMARALANARQAAQDIAGQLHLRLIALVRINANPVYNPPMPFATAGILHGLPYRFYAYGNTKVRITANVMLEYAYQMSPAH